MAYSENLYKELHLSEENDDDLSGENEDGMTDSEMYDVYDNDFDGESIDDQD
jgi:hypothetical protein